MIGWWSEDVEDGISGEGFPNGVLGLRQEINGAGELGLEPKGFNAGVLRVIYTRRIMPNEPEFKNIRKSTRQALTQGH